MYLEKTKIITLEQLKELSPLSVNVDDDKLINSLLYCQDAFIQPAIGSPLYDELIDQLTSNTVSVNNLILLNGNGYAFGGIRVCLAWYAFWKSLTYINYSVTRKGLNKKHDPNADAIELNDFNLIRSEALQTAENYRKHLVEFLEKDAKLATPIYPKFKQGIEDLTTKEPTTSSTGIAL
jgi:hypothetical protein